MSRVLHLYGSLARSLGSVCGGADEMLVDGAHGDGVRVMERPSRGISLISVSKPPRRHRGRPQDLPAFLASARGHVEHSEEYGRTVERIRCALSFFLAYQCIFLFGSIHDRTVLRSEKCNKSFIFLSFFLLFPLIFWGYTVDIQKKARCIYEVQSLRIHLTRPDSGRFPAGLLRESRAGWSRHAKYGKRVGHR